MSKFVKTLGLDEATELDVASTAITYVGKAPYGTLTSEAKWKIIKLTTTGDNLSTRAADLGSYTQVWDDRAGLTYT